MTGGGDRGARPGRHARPGGDPEPAGSAGSALPRGRHAAAGPDDRSLKGTTAVVTGASGAIGAAVAQGLAGRGAAVALLGRNRTRLHTTLRAITEAGGRAEALTVDVTDRDSVDAAVATVERDLGPVTLLVNAAGRIERHERPVWEEEPAEWWSVVTANLYGPFLMARALVPRMIAAGGGRVVDLNSGLGVRDGEVYSAYSASKAALARLGGSVALAGAPHGVRAFEVAPGLVRSAMTAGMPMHAEVPEERWTPVEATVDLVVAIAEGNLDELTGRYLRAGTDDAEALRDQARRIVERDARTLRIRPYGDDDPLA
jgi:NAD(P)-dependent dehydrogenase (short-subunit alcohol dehydrogenase family)